VNCAALPANLIESELFGHEKGAFTGAIAQKAGRFELADGGTLFLDEIGEMPLDLQSKLLRVLQEGEFERVGGSRTLKVDVRVIAATNRDLHVSVQEKEFRADLYYRLNVFPISSPSLRERKEDIPVLVNHFCKKYGVKFGKKITSVSKQVLDALMQYDWPGNVRELENIIERGIIVSTSNVLEAGDWLPKTILQASPASPATTSSSEPSQNSSLEHVERNHILEVLNTTRWKIRGENGAARILNLNPTTLEARMKKLGITRSGSAPSR
jgi:transcriptional regulator with GAF, ATPase, and Fis domain